MLWMLKTISHRQHRHVHLLKVSPAVPFLLENNKHKNFASLSLVVNSVYSVFHLFFQNCCGQKNLRKRRKRERIRLKIWIMIAEVYEENFTTVWTTFLILLTRWSFLNLFSPPNHLQRNVGRNEISSFIAKTRRLCPLPLPHLLTSLR